MNSDTQKFLETLFGEPDPEVTFQTFTDEKKKRADDRAAAKARGMKYKDPLAHVFHGRLSDYYEVLKGLNKKGAGIYVTVNQTDLRGRSKKNIIKINAVFQEDDAGYGYRNHYFMPQIETETSPGKFHRYWLTSSEKLDEFDSVQNRLVKDYGSDKNAKDISRVLRLPGFYHMKNPDEPFLVRLLECNGTRRHTWDQIKVKFPPVYKKKAVNTSPPGNGKLRQIGKLYAALRHIPADDYGIWIAVGMGLHHQSGGGSEGLALWDRWSQTSPKYESGICAEKWASFGKGEEAVCLG